MRRDNVRGGGVERQVAWNKGMGASYRGLYTSLLSSLLREDN